MDPEAGTTSGTRIKDRIKDQGSRIGSRIKDRIKDQGQGSRIKDKDQGSCPAMNVHPKRDTEVILRQSIAPIDFFNSRSV